MVVNPFLSIGNTRDLDRVRRCRILTRRSCTISNFKLLAESLIHAYYQERQRLDVNEISDSERRRKISCAAITSSVRGW